MKDRVSVSTESEHSHAPVSASAEPGINVNQLWETVLADLERQVPSNQFDNFFRNTRLMTVDNNVATIAAQNTFQAVTLEQRFGDRIGRALEKIIGRDVGVQVLTEHAHPVKDAVAEPTHSQPTVRPTRPRPAPPRMPERQTPLNNRQLSLHATENGLVPRLTFDTYVVGSSNALAHAAAMNIAEQPGTQYNPFFVHGGVGLGKTHLLHAIGHRALEINPDLTLMYVTSETFTNEVINAIRTQRMDEFRSRYRSIDILVVDDIQFIAGKESTQEEFFHTFNALYQNGKQVIVSSDKPPRAIAALEERMRSRFAGGLIADVGMPDFEMRTAILRAKAEELGVNLPPDVVEYIAHRDQTNIRELEGALNKILMMSQLYNRRLNLTLAMEALTDGGPIQRRSGTTASDVVRIVCDHFGIEEKDLKGRIRTREIAVPRQIAMYLIREETDISLQEIGRAIGGRDHTTVLHGIDKIQKQLENDVTLRASIMQLREQLMTRRS